MNYVEPLTPREWEVLALVAQGYTNRKIAEILVLEVTTVQSHLCSILGKLGAESRTQAVYKAYQLIPRDQALFEGRSKRKRRQNTASSPCRHDTRHRTKNKRGAGGR